MARSPYWFYGNDDGNWELVGRPVLSFRRSGFDWEMAPAMSSDNQRRNFRVEGATESNKGFRTALAEIVERHPELLDWVIRFDGPWLRLHDVLEQPAFSWSGTFYHGTSEAALPFIRQHGICPRDVTGSRPAYGGEDKAGRPDTVYLTTQLGMARFAARDASNVTRSPGVVLAVHGVDPRKVVPDEDSGEATARASVDRMGSFGVRGCIPPESVSVAYGWRDGEWQPINQNCGFGAAPQQQWWFHTSSRRNREGIQRHGLLLSKAFIDDLTPVGIYFTERPPAPGEREDADVWAADLTGFELHPDPFCGEDLERGDCVYVTRNVSSRRLRRRT